MMIDEWLMTYGWWMMIDEWLVKYGWWWRRWWLMNDDGWWWWWWLCWPPSQPHPQLRVTMEGNQGTSYVKETNKPFYVCTKDEAAVRMEPGMGWTGLCRGFFFHGWNGPGCLFFLHQKRTNGLHPIQKKICGTSFVVDRYIIYIYIFIFSHFQGCLFDAFFAVKDGHVSLFWKKK